MKKWMKVLSLVLAVTFALTAVVGCAGGNNTNQTTKVTGAADAGTDSPAFRIGGIGPLTGDGAAYGLAVQNAAQIAVDKINAAGGINGVPIQFQMQDDEFDEEKAVNAYNALKDWGMNILMGAVTSGCCVAVSGKSAGDNIFQITPSGSSASCIENNDNVFQVCFTDPNQGVGSAQYIGEQGVNGKPVEKAAVIYDSSDVYSSGIYEKFVEEAANQSFEIVAAEAFTSDNKTDFSVQLQKAKDAGATLVFLPVYYAEAALILAQANQMGYQPVFFGCDGLDGILSVQNFDTALAEGVILLTPFAADAQDEKTKAFVTEYQSRHNEIPNQFAADAYDAIYIIKAAIEKSGVVADMSASDICEGLKTAITQITWDGLSGAGMTWDASGEVKKDPKAMKIVDGAYHLIQ